MEIHLTTGLTGRMEMIVGTGDTAASYGSGLLPVFATPAMIGLMENTAQSSVQPLLPEGCITLGIEVNIKHLKATPVGRPVRCETLLSGVDGKLLLFEVNAWDDQALIGTGTHKRYVVEAKKFMEKLPG